MKKHIRNLRTLALTAVISAAPLTSGCMTYAPRFDSEGRYVGEQQVDDPGRTLGTFGAINGGLLGLGMQALGNHMSREQQRELNEEYRLRMQRQIDQMRQNNYQR